MKQSLWPIAFGWINITLGAACLLFVEGIDSVLISQRSHIGLAAWGIAKTLLTLFSGIALLTRMPWAAVLNAVTALLWIAPLSVFILKLVREGANATATGLLSLLGLYWMVCVLSVTNRANRRKFNG